MRHARAVPCAILLSHALVGCGGGAAVAPLGRAPQETSSPAAGMHRVSSGDTVYSIAWRHGLDYRDLARWNGIAEPYLIVPGQMMRLTRPARLPPVAPPRSEDSVTSREPERETSAPPPRAPRPDEPAPLPDRAVESWRWPARGTVTGAFGSGGGKGIDIENAIGTPIVASAPGRVVYSGSGLRGYGKLIIVKHNKRYLSAYAHNERLHVKEGDTVQSGQRIADMGSTGTKTVKLHFEIRRDGKPVDPTRYLPR